MASRSSHNKNNSAIKRIMQEARELATDPSTDYSAAPLEEDIFEWHCTLRGPAGTEFEGGLYHFRILLPAEYPFRPPSITMLTPNGRFELNTKICISFTNYHEELWQPAWGVRTAIIGLQGFFPLKGQAAVGVGSMEAPVSERRRLAKLSRGWVCPHCKTSNLECLPDPLSPDSRSEGVTRANTVEHVQTAGDSSEITNSTETSAEHETATAASLHQSDQQPALAPIISARAGATADLLTMDSHPQISDSELTGKIADSADDGVSSGAGVQPGTRPPTHAPSDLVSRPVGDSAREYATTLTSAPSPRPPLLLDAAIGMLLVLVAALVCRKVF